MSGVRSLSFPKKKGKNGGRNKQISKSATEGEEQSAVELSTELSKLQVDDP
jgi:hypothetical protein